MTPAEKKYNQYIGKLYWSANREWDRDKEEYKPIYDLVMPVHMHRRYGRGRYMLTVEILQFNKTTGFRQERYDIEASYFSQLVGKINQWQQGYILAKTGEVEKDVDQIQKAC